MKKLLGSGSGCAPDIGKWLKSPESCNNGSNNNLKIDEDKSKWLLVSTASPASMDVDGDDDDDDVEDELAQWLLVDRSGSEKDSVKAASSLAGSNSKIEEWLLAAAADREPSIVVLDDDDEDDDFEVASGSDFSGKFSNFN